MKLFITISVLILFSSFSSNKESASNKCGLLIFFVNNDNNSSDISTVIFRNRNTGITYTTSGLGGSWSPSNPPIGQYDITVYTDSQGLISYESGSTSFCQDAYSWNSDAQPYYFSHLNGFCSTIIITIDDIEC